MGQCRIVHREFRNTAHFKELVGRLQLIHGLVLLPITQTFKNFVSDVIGTSDI